MSQQVQLLQRRWFQRLLSHVVQAKPSAEAAADQARAVLGAALMVAAVEAATAAQLRAAALAPRAVNHVSVGPHCALRDLHAQECCRLQQWTHLGQQQLQQPGVVRGSSSLPMYAH